MRSLLTTLCLLLMMTVSTVPASASQAPAPVDSATPNPAPVAGLGIRLLDVPEDTQDDPRALAYIVDRIAPGTAISRRVQVTNDTGSPQRVFLYPGAAHIQDGTFIGDDIETSNDLSGWIYLEQQQVDLAPGSSADVVMTIKVPSDAPEGEQYGAVWAEMRSADDDDATGTILEVNRVGIRVYLSVGPGNGKPADFTISSFTATRDSKDNPQLSARVTNTGGRAVDVVGDLTLNEGPSDLSAGPFSVDEASTIAPGEAQEVRFVLPPEIPLGPWTAEVRLRSGLVERTASSPITFPAPGPAVSVAPVREPNTLLVIGGGITSALILALVTSSVLLRRRRRSRVREPREAGRGAPQAHSLRERYDP